VPTISYSLLKGTTNKIIMQNVRNFTSLIDIKNVGIQPAYKFTANLANPISIDTSIPHGLKLLLVSVTSDAGAPAASDNVRMIVGTSIVANSRVVDSNVSLLYISDFPVPGPGATVTKSVANEWAIIPLAAGTSNLADIPIVLQSTLDGKYLIGVETIGLTFEIVQLAPTQSIQVA